MLKKYNDLEAIGDAYFQYSLRDSAALGWAFDQTTLFSPVIWCSSES